MKEYVEEIIDEVLRYICRQTQTPSTYIHRSKPVRHRSRIVKLNKPDAGHDGTISAKHFFYTVGDALRPTISSLCTRVQE